MGWKVCFTALALPFVAACGSAPLMPADNTAYRAGVEQDRALAECRAKYPQKKPLTPRAKCFANAFEGRTAKLLNTVGNPIADIERAYSAQMVALAERYDKGGMTDSQLDAELAQLRVNAQTQMEARMNSAIMASAAQQQADAARQRAAMQSIMAGAAIMSPPMPAPPPLNMPTNTRCTNVGNTVNCQTW